MKRFIPSPAMAVALIALIVALSGTAVAAQQALAPANSVGTQALVNGSIRIVDIAPSTVRLLKGQTGSPGQQGPQGVQGVQGATGIAGAPGLPGGFNPAKLQFAQGSDVNVPPNTATTATVDCPAGTAVISGGGFTTGPGLWLTRASGNGWVVGATGYTSINTTVRAYALCSAP